MMTSVQELEGKEVVPGTSPTPSSGSNVQLIPPEPAPVRFHTLSFSV